MRSSELTKMPRRGLGCLADEVHGQLRKLDENEGEALRRSRIISQLLHGGYPGPRAPGPTCYREVTRTAHRDTVSQSLIAEIDGLSEVERQEPRWTPENRPVVDGAKPASGRVPRA
jgi:hypothetical protein